MFLASDKTFPFNLILFACGFASHIDRARRGWASVTWNEQKEIRSRRQATACLRGRNPSQITIYEHFSIKHTIAINNAAPATMDSCSLTHRKGNNIVNFYNIYFLYSQHVLIHFISFSSSLSLAYTPTFINKISNVYLFVCTWCTIKTIKRNINILRMECYVHSTYWRPRSSERNSSSWQLQMGPNSPQN